MSNEPTHDDAIALLRDPALRAMGPHRDGLVQMRGDELIDRLRRRGLDEVGARVLPRQAVDELDGEDRSGTRRYGLGGRQSYWQVDYWVPVSVFEDPRGAASIPIAAATARESSSAAVTFGTWCT